MIETIHHCDRCGAHGAHMKIWRLDVRAMELPQETPQGFEVADPRNGCYPQADWCRACCVEVFGWPPLKTEDPRKAKPAKKKPTIEELICEIMKRAFDADKPAKEGPNG